MQQITEKLATKKRFLLKLSHFQRSQEEIVKLQREIENNNFEVYLIDVGRNWFRLTDNTVPVAELIAKHPPQKLLCIPRTESLSYLEFIHNSDLTGAERAAITMNKELISQGVLATAVFPKPGPLVKLFAKVHVPTHIVPYSWWAGPTRLNRDIANQLVQSMKNVILFSKELTMINPHYISSQTSVIPWGLMAAIISGKLHAWHIHEFGKLDHGLNYYFGWNLMMRGMARFSSFISFNSQAVKHAYASFLLGKRTAVFQIPVTIDWPALNALRKVHFSKKNSTKLIVMGNISPSKGQKLVVQTISELAEEGYNFELVLVGKHTNEKYLLEIKDLALRSKATITIVNFTHNPYSYLNEADILLVPSRKEAYGLSALEAMTLKKLVIASKSGGITELVKSGVTGLTFKTASTQSLKKQLKYAMNNPKQINLIVARAFRFAEDLKPKYSQKLSFYASTMRQLTYVNRGATLLQSPIVSRVTLKLLDLIINVNGLYTSAINKMNGVRWGVHSKLLYLNHLRVNYVPTEGIYWTIIRKILYKNHKIHKLISPIVNTLKPEWIQLDEHKFYIDRKDEVVSQELIISGRWEKFQTDLVSSNIRNGDIVIDIGAHIGWYTLLAAKKVGKSGKVYAFEPDPRNFKLLTKNVERNNYDNVVLVNAAVSNKGGKSRLYTNTLNSGDNRFFDAGDSKQSVTVKTITLDDFFRNREKTVNLIKMDVQGYEAHVLLGAMKLVKANPKITLFTECWPEGLEKSGFSTTQFIKLLTKMGFTINNIIEESQSLQKLTATNLSRMHLFTNEETNLWCVKDKEC